MGIGYNHSIQAVVQGLTPWSSICHRGFWCLPRSPFWCVACGTYWVVFCYGPKVTSGCVGSGSSWEGLHSRLMSDTACGWLTVPVRSYKAICNCSCLCWVWVCMGGAMHPSSASTSSGPGAGSTQKDRACLQAVWEKRLDTVTWCQNPSLALKPHNSVTPCMSLAPLPHSHCCSSARAQDAYL